jgi:RluA family pseudouridine synthase
VNDKRIRDGSLLLNEGDRVAIFADLQSTEPAQDDRVWTLDSPDVLHRDDDYLVVNKPAGVACSDDGADPGALQVWLREYLAEDIAAGQARPEPCHRLDRGTTGIVVVALTPKAFDRFRVALEEHRVRKVYEVFACGRTDEEEFTCTQALTRVADAGPDEPRMVAGDQYEARTDFRVIEARGPITRLEARLHTGRTHQIRAHLRILGLPVLGDPRYGEPRAIGHQVLHARQLELEGSWSVTAPWPETEAAWLRSIGFAP